MSYFKRTTALLALFFFSATFVAFESHGTSLCDPSISHQMESSVDAKMKHLDQVIKTKSAEKSDSSDSQSSGKRDCQCAHSANCLVIFVEHASAAAPFVAHLRYPLVMDDLFSVVMDGLIRPPRV